MYFKTLSRRECCACSACLHSCPQKCIKFIEDEEGFFYPHIDQESCINCGLCEKVCPVEHPDYSNFSDPSVYASYLKDTTERQHSSSGGLFYAIASWIFHQGGHVYGATIDQDNQVYHVGVDSIVNINKLRGSKYVESKLRDVFKEIKTNLLNNRWCYFVGTPCQVAGLKGYLRKEYDKLLTSDLVCHGVPSQWIFDQHISFLEKKYDGKVANYQFRNNKEWGGVKFLISQTNMERDE